MGVRATCRVAAAGTRLPRGGETSGRSAAQIPGSRAHSA
ncbi:hypothetical protein C731_1666 [Mycolicibacterium hassiacum DSM 44199]|uniref:Uncharacterized protein n=1 Tax=Mycolicibacterium hassiacum (strain DSM 44199 / CIP 105218 / JCM 12690 / 3849) TaxID=1122247 RepID=K5BBN3_MYCHD|nr:hypothetical protein C731_1666 [Mycolicibacterium hassiacum DSM 44199]